MGSNMKVLWVKKKTPPTTSLRDLINNLFFEYQDGRKYGIELLNKEGYKGSKLIIRGTNNSDTGGFFQKHSLSKSSDFFRLVSLHRDCQSATSEAVALPQS